MENLISKVCVVFVLSKPFMLDILRDKERTKRKENAWYSFYF